MARHRLCVSASASQIMGFLLGLLRDEHVGQVVPPRDQISTRVTHLCFGCLSHFHAILCLDPVVSCPTVASVHPSRLLCSALGSNMARHRRCVSASALQIMGFILGLEHARQLV